MRKFAQQKSLILVQEIIEVQMCENGISLVAFTYHVPYTSCTFPHDISCAIISLKLRQLIVVNVYEKLVTIIHVVYVLEKLS